VDTRSWTVETAPSAEPILKAAAKTHMRITVTDHDDYIDALIIAARKTTEHLTGRALITQTIELRLDRFPTTIYLPRGPVQSVTSIKYYDTAGDEQTLDAAEYQTELYSDPPRIEPEYGYSWPSTQDRMAAVTVKYIAGYGDAGTDVPDDLIHALKLLVAHWFESSEPVISGSIPRDVEMTYNFLIKNYKVRLPG